ncbi:hypothetical protein HYU09_01300 [Candidatus Woesearchaeota archaeon]|nr:hypothetical protein [Candidatus Woesearchaeota archaeon]
MAAAAGSMLLSAQPHAYAKPYQEIPQKQAAPEETIPNSSPSVLQRTFDFVNRGEHYGIGCKDNNPGKTCHFAVNVPLTDRDGKKTGTLSYNIVTSDFPDMRQMVLIEDLDDNPNLRFLQYNVEKGKNFTDFSLPKYINIDISKEEEEKYREEGKNILDLIGDMGRMSYPIETIAEAIGATIGNLEFILDGFERKK